MGARSFFPGSKFSGSRRAKASTAAFKPLEPHELAGVRELLIRGEELFGNGEDLDAGAVAKMVGLTRRTVLDHIREGTAFPNAYKPAHNRVRIPLGDVLAFKAARRVFLEGRNHG